MSAKKDDAAQEKSDNQELKSKNIELDLEESNEKGKNKIANKVDKEKDVELLALQLEKLKQESEENLDKAIRAQAEMENLRKRASRDIENAHKYALEKFTNELLPVIDSLELGLSASVDAEKAGDIYKGMELTLEKFTTVIEKFGIEKINPKGEKFDPELHEAVSMQETNDKNSGNVVAVMQKGYTLNGRLIRPAMVIVAK